MFSNSQISLIVVQIHNIGSLVDINLKLQCKFHRYFVLDEYMNLKQIDPIKKNFKKKK